MCIYYGFSILLIFNRCNEEDKDAYLYYILSVHGQGRTIVFCTSIAALRHISSVLRILAVNVWTLHAQMQQRARLKVISPLLTFHFFCCCMFYWHLWNTESWQEDVLLIHISSMACIFLWGFIDSTCLWCFYCHIRGCIVTEA